MLGNRHLSLEVFAVFKRFCVPKKVNVLKILEQVSNDYNIVTHGEERRRYYTYLSSWNAGAYPRNPPKTPTRKHWLTGILLKQVTA